MLQTSGQISHSHVLAEVGLSSSSNSLNQQIRTQGGVRQFMINNGTWKPCNMCSPNLPKDTAPFSIKDWYGYDHSIQSVTGVTISGDLTVDAGQTVTYTATLAGTVISGSTITWYKFDNGVWSSSLGTGTSVTITWVYPANALLKAVVFSPCSGTTLEHTEIVTWNCVPITDGFVWGQETNLYTGTEYTYSCTIQVGTANQSLQFEIDSYGVNFVITQKNIAWDAGAGQYYINIKIIGYTPQHVGLVVRLKNYCTSSWYTVQTKDLYFINPPSTETNDARTATLCKTCPSGYTGTCKSVSRAAGIFTGATKAEANAIRDTDMQNEVNNDSLMYCSSETTGNDQRSGWFQKQCSSGYIGSNHEYIVYANTYFANTKENANTLALNDVTTNGQNYANSVGTCTADGGGCVTPNLCLNAIRINGSGFNRYVANNTSVSIDLQCVTGNNLTYSWKINGSTVSTSSSFSYSFNFGSTFPDKFNNGFTLEVTISNGCGSFTRTTSIWLERFYNERQTGTFYKDNCTQGTPDPYTNVVEAETFLGETLTEANTLAMNQVNSTGQSNANTYGTCTYVPTDPCEHLHFVSKQIQQVVLNSSNTLRKIISIYTTEGIAVNAVLEVKFYSLATLNIMVCSTQSYDITPNPISNVFSNITLWSSNAGDCQALQVRLREYVDTPSAPSGRCYGPYTNWTSIPS
jgi:hypothetical protein